MPPSLRKLYFFCKEIMSGSDRPDSGRIVSGRTMFRMQTGCCGGSPLAICKICV